MSATSNGDAQAPQTRLARSSQHDQLRADWRSASADALAAYRSWSLAPRAFSADVFAAYVAALDREEAAANHLRCAINGIPVPQGIVG